MNPSTGRFISEDPIGFAGQDANLYRYVGNNPVNYTDPLGLLSFSENLERRQGINKKVIKKVGQEASKLIVGASVVKAGGFVSTLEGLKSKFNFANLGRLGTIGSVAIGTVAKTITVGLSFGVGFKAGDYLGAYLDTIVDDGGLGSSVLENLYFGSGQPNNTPNSCSL